MQALVFRTRPRRAALGRFLALMAALLFAASAAGAAPYTHTHYQKNMAFGNNSERALANDIIRRQPDTVTLQEVNRDNDKLLDMIRDFYPSQNFCYFKGIGGVAVASRWPMVAGSGRCIDRLGATAIEVRMPDGPVWVISIHLETRDKPRHARQAADLARVLGQFEGRLILGGDFNDLPQSGPVREIEKGARVARIGSAISTYRVGGLLGIPIDFVMATGGRGSVEKLPLLGSDHYGVWAKFTMGR